MTRPVCGSVLAVAFVLAIEPGHTVAQNARNPRLVAIFAHPDDEIVVGPMLARYAREGHSSDGHPDHRIVGAVVTEIVQGWPDGNPPSLFYPGFPRQHAVVVPESPFSRTPTLERFLTVRVPYEPRDFDATSSAFACHETQYTQQQRERGLAGLMKLLDGSFYLRPAFAEQPQWTDIIR